jgi:flagellar hook protein FlgE
MDGLSISASGIAAAQQRHAITANNVANLHTPGYRQVRGELVEGVNGGVELGSVSSDDAPEPLESTGQSPNVASNVNLVDQQVNQILDRNLLQANANAFRAQSDLLGELIDLAD